MSAKHNKAIVRRWNEQIWKGDQTVFAELLAPNCVFHWMGGVDEIKQTIARIRNSFSDLRLSVEDQLACDDKVVTRWTLSGTHCDTLWGVVATGKTVTYSGITINRLVESYIVEEWCEADLLGLMQQIGALPSSDDSAEDRSL